MGSLSEFCGIVSVQETFRLIFYPKYGFIFKSTSKRFINLGNSDKSLQLLHTKIYFFPHCIAHTDESQVINRGHFVGASSVIS